MSAKMRIWEAPTSAKTENRGMIFQKLGCPRSLFFDAWQAVHQFPLPIVEDLGVYLCDLGVGVSEQLRRCPQVFEVVVGVRPE